METLTIDILNPKVKGILKQLADLKLIAIVSRQTNDIALKTLLERTRSVDPEGLRMDEIVSDVELIRGARYAKKKEA